MFVGFSLRVLRENPRDFEAHWGAGLSFAHKAMDNEGLSLPAKQQYLNQVCSQLVRWVPYVGRRPPLPCSHA